MDARTRRRTARFPLTASIHWPGRRNDSAANVPRRSSFFWRGGGNGGSDSKRYSLRHSNAGQESRLQPGGGLDAGAGYRRQYGHFQHGGFYSAPPASSERSTAA